MSRTETEIDLRKLTRDGQGKLRLSGKLWAERSRLDLFDP
jgi:hypothetical protein